MHRFYIGPAIDGDDVAITDARQLHHLKDVLRPKVGDEVIIFDRQGNEYTCSIKELQERQVRLTVKARRRTEVEKTRITVACAIPKKTGMDDIIDNLTQLGVDNIIPMMTERVIIRLDDTKREARLQRWRRIAESAAQQSQRNTLPLIAPITSLESVIAHSQDFDLKLIPTLPGQRKPIREALIGPRRGNVLVLIGPEGDFTPREIGLAAGAGFVPVSLGEHVLRVGTAAVAVVGYIRLALIT